MLTRTVTVRRIILVVAWEELFCVTAFIYQSFRVKYYHDGLLIEEHAASWLKFEIKKPERSDD